MKHTSKILIVTDEPIFSFGLKVQFYSWGFASVEVVKNCQLALHSIDKQVPALVIVDEKFLQGQIWGRSLLLLTELKTIPAIFLSADKYATDYKGSYIKKQYVYLSKPCQIVDLQVAVEALLGINTLAS